MLRIYSRFIGLRLVGELFIFLASLLQVVAYQDIMPPRKKAKLAYPLIKKDYRRYIERPINVADNWWEGKPFGRHDSRTLCVVVDHDPIHKFPHRSTCHAMAVRVIDPLSAEERMTAKDDDDPEQYTRVYWMTIDAFSQFHDETHPN